LGYRWAAMRVAYLNSQQCDSHTEMVDSDADYVNSASIKYGISK